MSTKRTVRTAAITGIREKFRTLESSWPDPLAAPAHAASAALAVTVALLRALRDRGLLTEGEIDDLFAEAAEHLRDTSTLNLLNCLRGQVEHKGEE
jgi:hypothetical protein